jgi:hypothetical protein
MARRYNAIFDRQARLLAAVVLVIGLIGAGNYFLDIGLFGRFGKVVYVLSTALLVGFAFFFVIPRYERGSAVIRTATASNNRSKGRDA